jgi:hypothetical protein
MSTPIRFFSSSAAALPPQLVSVRKGPSWPFRNRNYIRIKSLNHVLQKVQALSMKLNPMFAGMVSLDTLLKGLPADVQQPVREALDPDGPLAVVVYPPEPFEKEDAAEPEFCILLPIKSLDVAQPLTDRPPTPNLAIRLTERFALISSRETGISRLIKSLGEKPDVPVDDLSCEVQILSFPSPGRSLIERALRKQMQTTEALARAGDAQAKDRLLGQKLGWDFTRFFFRECRQAAYELEVGDMGIRLRCRLDPVPDGELARMFRTFAVGRSPDLSPRVPGENACLVGSGHVAAHEFARVAKHLAAVIVEKAAAEGRIPEEAKPVVDQAVQKLHALLDAGQGNIAVSLVPSQKETAVVLGFGIKAEPGQRVIRGLLDDLHQAAQKRALADNAEIKRSSRESQGVPVDAFVSSKNADTPLEIACLPDMVLLVAGFGAPAIMDTAIARAKSPGTLPPLLEKAATHFPGARLATCSFSVLRLAELAARAQGNEAMAQNAGALAAQDEPVMGALMLRDGQIVVELMIPVKPMQLVQPLIMQAMMRPPEGGQPPMPHAPPGR